MEGHIRSPIPRMARSLEKPDWELFERVQEPHRQAWKNMLKEWKEQYNFGKTEEIRKQAGENLGYGEIRFAVHEYFRPLYWTYDVLFR